MIGVPLVLTCSSWNAAAALPSPPVKVTAASNVTTIFRTSDRSQVESVPDHDRQHVRRGRHFLDRPDVHAGPLRPRGAELVGLAGPAQGRVAGVDRRAAGPEPDDPNVPFGPIALTSGCRSRAAGVEFAGDRLAPLSVKVNPASVSIAL